ncbi:MAG: lysophospholipid acyltransferase family protein [Gammaproteobacteria bacterium]|nr:lysophospholipid acyltransferase family protein [Gammaproteobacteria bacterium]
MRRQTTHTRLHTQRTGGRRTGSDWLRLAFAASPGLARLHRLRESVQELADPFAAVRYVLEQLEVTIDLGAVDATRIPAAGPAVITANHPFGALDGLIGIDTIARRRQDLRVLANPELAALPGIGAVVIAVDPFGGSAATRANVTGMRQALRWLESGGALLIFPAGEVSNLDLRTGRVNDRTWSPTAARLIRLSGAAVTPMHFAGANSPLFQLAGFVHPRLRTLLLPYELSNKAGSRIVVRVGEAVPAERCKTSASDLELAGQLRLLTYLSGAGQSSGTHSPKEPRRPAPVTDPVDPRRLASEVESLPADTLLLSSGNLRVYCAPATLLPVMLQELGRLRECTFRAVGEGTGRSTDIDAFDAYYEHLFIWNESTLEISGAYRLGRTDRIARQLGKAGLYTSTLFEYHDLFFKLLGPALELGRSFVRAEQQKSFAPLLLLWRGIGEYVGRHPEYCKLLGPVSISNDYSAWSRALLAQFLRQRKFDPLAPAMVRARRPFRSHLSLRSLGCVQPSDLQTLSALLAGLEPDGKGPPVLLRQYLKLGGRVLGFNVDPDFSDSLDCLVLVDLRRTEPRVLEKYMSRKALESFRHRHGRRPLHNSA